MSADQFGEALDALVSEWLPQLGPTAIADVLEDKLIEIDEAQEEEGPDAQAEKDDGN